jgi:predicted nucleic-acid-binding protein
MIGVDTNVLLRLLIVEDPRQNELAKSFFAARSVADPARISLVVMAELVWVLRSKYKYRYERVAPVIQAMLDSDDFVIEARDLVEWALANYTKSKIDFSDLLVAHSNERSGCTGTVTFDQDAARYIPGMELLA